MRSLLAFFIFIFILGCGQTAKPVSVNNLGAFYGENFNANEAIDLGKAIDNLKQLNKVKLTGIDKETVMGQEIVVKGLVSDLCKHSGCWMEIKGEDDQVAYIKFHDSKFVVPKDINGKKAYIKGNIYETEVAVEDLKTLAKSNNEPDSVINKIVLPKKEYNINAFGVFINN